MAPGRGVATSLPPSLPTPPPSPCGCSRSAHAALFPPPPSPPPHPLRGCSAARRSPPRAALRLPQPQDGGSEPVGGRGPVPGHQRTAGIPQTARVAVLHLRLRHVRGVLGVPAPQPGLSPPQPHPRAPPHRQLRVPLPAAPGVFRGAVVRGGPPRARVPGGRLLVGRSVLRGGGSGRVPVCPRGPGGVPVPGGGLPPRGAAPQSGPGGDGGAGVPVAGGVVRLGGGAGGREGGHGARGGPGADLGVSAPGGAPVPGAGGAARGRAQYQRDFRVPEPGALDGQRVVRVQGDGLGGAWPPRPPPGGPPEKAPEAGGGVGPHGAGVRPPRGGVPAPVRPRGARGGPRDGVRPGGPHGLQQPDVGSSCPIGGAALRSRQRGGGAWGPGGRGLSPPHSPAP